MNEKYYLIDGIIPSLLCYPTSLDKTKHPAVLLLHGFGSQKNEVGDFYVQLAHQLADIGIASLRIDFQGFGESQVDMCLSSLDNMLTDAKKAYHYLARCAQIDSSQIAICGFSLGAYVAFRLAHDLERHSSITCPGLVMLSPSGHPANSFTRVLGCSDLDPATKAPITTFDMGWRTVSLGPCFFESLLSNPPIVALGQLNTSSLSVAAREDLTHPYLDKIAALTPKADTKTITIEDSNHIFGIHTPATKVALVIDNVTQWLFHRFELSPAIKALSETFKEETKPCLTVILDIDNCIFNYRYHDSVDKHAVLHNSGLIDYLIKDRQQFSELIIGCGSLRQSESDDDFNSERNETGSGLFAIAQMAKHLDATIKPLLLADIFGDLPIGTSYHRIMGDYWKEPHHIWLIDESKLTIIYAHCHTVHPDKTHLIDFYDDLKDMLLKLYNFFKKHKEMIPNNVSLRFNEYEGDLIRRSKVIQGTGGIDTGYRQTILDMHKITPSGADCVDYVTPDLLAQQRLLSHSSSAEIEISSVKSRALGLSTKRYKGYRDAEEALRCKLSAQSVSEIEHDRQVRAYILQLDIARGALSKVQILLDHDPSLVRYINEEGKTLLHLAILAKKNQMSMINLLVKAQVELDKAISHSGLTALHLALLNGNTEICRYLVDAGANIQITIQSEDYKVINRPDRCQDGYLQTPLFWASFKGYKHIVAFLIANGADFCEVTKLPRMHVNFGDNGNSALDWAMKGRHTDVILMLIKAGARANRAHGRVSHFFKPDDSDIDLGVDVSDEEMAASDFGRRSNAFELSNRLKS